MLIGHHPAAGVPVGYLGMGGGVEVALAADVQAGIIPLADVLGAEHALAVVVVEGLPGHDELQELVPARPQRPHLGDGVHVAVEGAQPADAALYLGLDQDRRRRQPPLGPRVLAGAVADVVDHHCDDPPAAALGLAGQGVSVVGGQGRGAAAGRRRLGGGGRRRGRRAGRRSGIFLAEQFLQPVQQAALGAGPHQGQGRGGCARAAQHQTAGDLHRASLLCNGMGRERCPDDSSKNSLCARAHSVSFIVTILYPFVKRKFLPGAACA